MQPLLAYWLGLHTCLGAGYYHLWGQSWPHPCPCCLPVPAVHRNKFGPHGMRIWRLLLLSGQLEQKQVADLAMLTKEDAREKLYGMLKAG